MPAKGLTTQKLTTIYNASCWHPGNWLPWIWAIKNYRRKIAKINPKSTKSNEKFVLSARIIFWLPSFLNFFPKYDICIHVLGRPTGLHFHGFRGQHDHHLHGGHGLQITQVC